MRWHFCPRRTTAPAGFDLRVPYTSRAIFTVHVENAVPLMARGYQAARLCTECLSGMHSWCPSRQEGKVGSKSKVILVNAVFLHYDVVLLETGVALSCFLKLLDQVCQEVHYVEDTRLSITWNCAATLFCFKRKLLWSSNPTHVVKHERSV